MFFWVIDTQWSLPGFKQCLYLEGSSPPAHIPAVQHRISVLCVLLFNSPMQRGVRKVFEVSGGSLTISLIHAPCPVLFPN